MHLRFFKENLILREWGSYQNTRFCSLKYSGNNFNYEVLKEVALKHINVLPPFRRFYLKVRWNDAYVHLCGREKSKQVYLLCKFLQEFYKYFRTCKQIILSDSFPKFEHNLPDVSYKGIGHEHLCFVDCVLLRSVH